MLSSQNVAIVKIPFRSRVTVFSNNRLLFISMGRGFAIGNSGTADPSMLCHEQTIFGEEIHILITFIVIVMASNTVDGLYINNL